QFEEANIAYNIPAVYVFEGRLDYTTLESSFETLLTRHEVLCTVFRENEQGEIRQYINSASATGFRISFLDLRGDKDQERILPQLVQKDFISPFDLSQGPLLRVSVIQVSEDKWVFTFVMHHIISDGWSMSVLIRELLSLYNTTVNGVIDPLPPLRIQYKDYVCWQHEQLSAAVMEEHKAFWLQQFSGELPVLDLNGGKMRPAIKTYSGAMYNRAIDEQTSKGLKALLQQQGVTLFAGLMAAVNALLYRYTGQEDMIIGSPVAGRDHAELDQQVGLYANTLALRIQFSGEKSYRNLLQQVQQVVLEANAHQLYPFDELVHALQLQRDMSRSPLFDIQVIVSNAETGNIAEEQRAGEVLVKGYAGAEKQTSVFDMVFNFIETASGLHLSVHYNRDVYESELVAQLAGHLDQLLGTLIAHPDKALHQLELLCDSDKEVLEQYNNTAVELPAGKTLVAMFKEQLQAYGNEVAVVYGDMELTYKELDERSNALAGYLQGQYNIRSGEIVAMMVDRTEKAIIAILGILKCGAAYVPVDPEYPAARKEFILKDTGARVLITQTEYIFDLPYFTGNVFAIDVQLEELQRGIALEAEVSSEELAYIIYTSGSTGTPKGVMIEHGAIANTIYAQGRLFDVHAADRNLQFASLSFDASVSEIFVALATGGVLYIIEETAKKDPSLLEQYILANEITIATIPPAYLQLLNLEKIKRLKRLVTAGEPAVYDKVIGYARQGVYFNAYGPTESSICSTIYRFNEANEPTGRNIPIGQPIYNTRIYIIDDHGNLVPRGVSGEICIAGAGLARGYLNRAELTEEKFVADPFTAGGRMYKTGDIGRWLPDGTIAFLGRKDHQVKIRGYRIELAEIETVLQLYAGVDAAVVTVHAGADGNKELVAYIISREVIEPADLQHHLGQLLPAYMIPAHYVQLDHFPVTPNGKIDRKRLPAPEQGSQSSIEYIAPRTETEQKLAA
ncbi:non-ribosomal peptide synthetase, partial [Niastella populi]|uniref:non-ribosomal peptide synthetase n=1 Tax=Niastella populi TaxID=550983 RepID=UPI0010544BC2